MHRNLGFFVFDTADGDSTGEGTIFRFSAAQISVAEVVRGLCPFLWLASCGS